MLRGKDSHTIYYLMSTSSTRWPVEPSDPENTRYRERFELALGQLPPLVGDSIRAWCRTDGFRGRAAYWGAALAGLAGYRPTSVLSNDRIRFEGPGRGPFVMGLVSCILPNRSPGSPEDLRRLLAALEPVSGAERYVLHLRKPIPPGFDPTPVVGAVQLWQYALARGEWQGRYAVYEDDDVWVELTLTSLKRSGNQSSLLFLVPPSNAEDKLKEVRNQVLALSSVHEQADPGVPLVVVLAAEPAWQLPPGQVNRLLYGSPDSVNTAYEDGYRISRFTYRPNARALFADPTCIPLAALWWTQASPGDHLGVAGWAHTNPWCPFEDRAPGFPGACFSALEMLRFSRQSGAPSAMMWNEDPATVWRSGVVE